MTHPFASFIDERISLNQAIIFPFWKTLYEIDAALKWFLNGDKKSTGVLELLTFPPISTPIWHLGKVLPPKVCIWHCNIIILLLKFYFWNYLLIIRICDWEECHKNHCCKYNLVLSFFLCGISAELDWIFNNNITMFCYYSFIEFWSPLPFELTLTHQP